MSKDFWEKMDEFDRAAEKVKGYVTVTKLTEQEIHDINRAVRKRKEKNKRIQSKSDKQVLSKCCCRLEINEIKGFEDRR